ncbi:MAG: hypothetical protein ABIL90_03620 [candidate division WOR-3 bacterium]
MKILNKGIYRQKRLKITQRIFIIFIMFFLFSCERCQRNIIEEKNNYFYDERNISRMKGSSFIGRRIAIDRFGDVHVVWSDSAPGNNWEIIYKMKLASGEWTDTQNVSKTLTQSTTPSIGVDIYGNPHVVWVELVRGKPIIYYSYKENGAWKGPQEISTIDDFADLPDIGIDREGRVHVIYMGGPLPGVRYTRKEGDSWTPLTHLPGNGNLNPSLYVEENGKLHVVFECCDDIYYVYSPNGGNTWEGPVNISNSPSYYSWSSDVVVDKEGKVYVCWIEAKFGIGIVGIFISEKDTNGIWSIPEKVTSVNGSPFFPRIRNIYGGNIYITYMDLKEETGGIFENDVFCVKKTNNTWAKPFNISNTPGNSTAGCHGFKISSDRLYIAWTEEISRDEQEIYYDEIIINTP